MDETPQLLEGRQQLTENWSLTLPGPMARRIDDDGPLVFWNTPAGLTFWLTSYDGGQDPAEVIGVARQNRAPLAFDMLDEVDRGIFRLGYRVHEEAEDGRQPAFYGHVVGPNGDLLMIAAYFNMPEQIDAVLAAWRSIAWED